MTKSAQKFLQVVRRLGIVSRKRESQLFELLSKRAHVTPDVAKSLTNELVISGALKWKFDSEKGEYSVFYVEQNYKPESSEVRIICYLFDKKISNITGDLIDTIAFGPASKPSAVTVAKQLKVSSEKGTRIEISAW